MNEILDWLASFFSTSHPSFLRRCWRVAIDSVRGFINDDCYSKASALTFYSILSIVPLLAVLFGVAKGFGFERALEIEIRERFAEQPELTNRVIEFAYSWLETVKGGLIAGVGTAVLLWSVLGLLNNIETALNAIWKTKIPRSFARKMTDFLAALLIGPIFIATVSSLNVFITTRVVQNVESNILIEAVSPFILFIVRLTPYFLSWLLFTFIYMFMPNTKVYLRTALLAGILAGTAFQLWQWIYIRFQIGVASYGAIYGSFAAIPLFLIWLQTSWVIFLAGAEVAVELENDLFVPMRRPRKLSLKAAALFMMYRCLEAFAQGKPPVTDHSLAQELGLSLHYIQMILEALENHHLLVNVTSRGKMEGYQPARALHTITMKDVSDAIEINQDLEASYSDSPAMLKIEDYLKKIDQTLTEPALNGLVYPST